MTMNAKFLFIFAHGIKLFLNCLKKKPLPILSLSALFLILHTAFSIGGGISRFADKVAAFDTIRVYLTENADLQILSKRTQEMQEVETATIYTDKDTKEYVKRNAPTIKGIELLPDSLFPSFLEVVVKKDYQSAETLESLATQMKQIDGVESASYGQEWANRLSEGKKAVSAILLIAIIVFTAAGVVITYQTVGVLMYEYIEDIRVYSIVGGTRMYVISPFLVFTVCVGSLCALLSLLGYKIIYIALLLPLTEITGLTMSLPWYYCIIFLASVPIITKVAGFFSAANFLNKAYDANK